MEHLGDEESGVLIADETGFLKKGEKSVGVARQYTGTAQATRSTARSGCLWPTPRRREPPSSTGRCICPSSGRMTQSAGQALPLVVQRARGVVLQGEYLLLGDSQIAAHGSVYVLSELAAIYGRDPPVDE